MEGQTSKPQKTQEPQAGGQPSSAAQTQHWHQWAAPRLPRAKPFGIKGEREEGWTGILGEPTAKRG